MAFPIPSGDVIFDSFYIPVLSFYFENVILKHHVYNLFKFQNFSELYLKIPYLKQKYLLNSYLTVKFKILCREIDLGTKPLCHHTFIIYDIMAHLAK